MRYCPNCQSLCDDEDACPFCGNKKLRQPEETDPVLLMTADETKAEMIEMVLQDAGIVFEERALGPGGPPSALLGYNRIHMNKNLFVPYGELERAHGIVEGLFPPDGEEVPAEQEELPAEEDETDAPRQEESPAEAGEEEMGPRRRTAVRIVSVILFLLVVWAVVAVSDYAANALKDFLANLF